MKTQNKIEFLENVLNDKAYVNLFEYIYKNKKSIFTEQELINQIPDKNSNGQNIDKTLLLSHLVRAGLLDKSGLSGNRSYRRLKITNEKFRNKINTLNMNYSIKKSLIIGMTEHNI